jgi:hypothetical protein
MRRLALIAALGAAAALPASAGAATLPKIATVAPLADAWPGAHVPVAAVVRGGGARSGRTRIQYLLSRDGRLGRGDRALGRAHAIPALAPHRSRRSTSVITIPARTRLGRWYLLACVGSGARRRCVSVPLPILAKPSARGVTVLADPAHAATQRIAAATGGTVTATGADGSRYTLVLPANALISDETISLTPVTGLRGLRGHGRPAAGVQLSPDGLVLLRPATLTIAPARGVPVARQIGYSWHGSGRESGLYPPTLDANSFTMRLVHFSGYELIDGGAADRASLANQPTNVQDRWAEVEAAAAAARAGGDTPAATARFTRAMHDYLQTQYDAVVKPQLEAAMGDDTLAYAALQAGLAWAHNAAVLGAGFAAEQRYVTDAMVTILDNAIRASAARCDAGQIAFVQRMLAIARIRAVLGSPESNADLDAIQKCLQFRLDFTANSTMNAGWVWKSTVEVKDLGISALAGPAASGAGSVTAPVKYTSQTEVSHGAGCVWSFGATQEQEPFTVYSLSLDASLREVIGSGGRATFQTPPPSFTLDMSPGTYFESAQGHCPGAKMPLTTDKLATYFGSWYWTHRGEATGTNRYVLTGWSAGGGGQLAQLHFDRTVPAPGCPCSWSQQSTFIIRQAAGG